jgi:hypothetical protein
VKRLAALLPLMKLQLCRLFVGLVAALVIVACIGGGSTTTVGAATYTYDAPALARVDAHAFGAAQASLAVLREVWDWSGSPAASLRGESTTTSRSVVATEAAGELPGLSSSAAQLEAKFKHAADFGVLESRGASGFEAFGKAVDSFVGDSATVRVMGTYRGSPAILNYNPATAQVVVQATDGAFVSGWQMSPAQLQNVITKASLGGG